MKESNEFLTQQIITYIGNKRRLIKEIEKEVKLIKKKLGKEKMVCVDLFSGSGVVARMLKQYSDILFVNDLEEYSKVINECYLTNKNDFDINVYNQYKSIIENGLFNLKTNGLIYSKYAPKNDFDIKKGERVFYTSENAKIIDTYRSEIDSVDCNYKRFFLAPLLYEASVHVNTGGIFKGFYKDTKTGIGKFGGNAENALLRIKGKIELKEPIFSNFDSKVFIKQEDANALVKKLGFADIIYIDPPYNQHPYGSNYFMLNLILRNELRVETSKISGIPKDWKRSNYNKQYKVLNEFDSLIKNSKASFLIVSYNSEGFIALSQMKELLSKYGKLKTVDINYNTYRASRNLENRNKYVKEYLFILDRRQPCHKQKV